ncbi:hypothetical protein [Acinetobacter sp. ANC 4639]
MIDKSYPTVSLNYALLNVKFGSAFSLQATIFHSENTAYQWFLDDQKIEGATDSSYVISSVNHVHLGEYKVFVKNLDNGRGTYSGVCEVKED